MLETHFFSALIPPCIKRPLFKNLLGGKPLHLELLGTSPLLRRSVFGDLVNWPRCGRERKLGSDNFTLVRNFGLGGITSRMNQCDFQRSIGLPSKYPATIQFIIANIWTMSIGHWTLDIEHGITRKLAFNYNFIQNIQILSFVDSS